MNQECTTATSDTAARIRREFGAVGFTVEGLPDDLTPEQGLEFLKRFLVELQAVTA